MAYASYEPEGRSQRSKGQASFLEAPRMTREPSFRGGFVFCAGYR